MLANSIVRSLALEVESHILTGRFATGQTAVAWKDSVVCECQAQMSLCTEASAAVSGAHHADMRLIHDLSCPD